MLLQHNLIQRYEFSAQIPRLCAITIPRWVVAGRQVATEVHIFADASMTAFGAAAYVRCVAQTGDITTHLLCSKSRVEPLKTQSVLRLELFAALLAAQLAESLRKSLPSDYSYYFWTDSSIVLAWVRKGPAPLAAFIRVRIAKILELSDATRWRHVGTAVNPADIHEEPLPLSLPTLSYGGTVRHGCAYRKNNGLHRTLRHLPHNSSSWPRKRNIDHVHRLPSSM